MLRRTLQRFLSAPTNHRGQRFPPHAALALAKASEENNFSSHIWVTKAVLDEYGHTATESVKPTIVEITRRPMSFFNAEQVGFYIPKGIGFLYRGDKAKEMVLAAKLHQFKSPYWIAAQSSSHKGLNPKPDQSPIMIQNTPYYNADQIEGGAESMTAADARVQSLPMIAFRSITGKRYSTEMCADLSEFLINNSITHPGRVWGTAKAFQKHSISVNQDAVPYQIVSDDGSVYDLFNGAQTSEPEVADQLGLARPIA